MHHSQIIFGHVSPPISNQLKLCRLHHRQVARFRSLEEEADVSFQPGARRRRRSPESPGGSGIPGKALASNRFSGERFHAAEFGNRIELLFPSRTVGWFIYHSTVHRFESESSVDITADAVPEPNRFSPVT